MVWQTTEVKVAAISISHDHCWCSKMIGHSTLSSWMDYANTLLHSMLASNLTCYRWHRSHWLGQSVRPQVLPVPTSYAGNFTGYQFTGASQARRPHL